VSIVFYVMAQTGVDMWYRAFKRKIIE